MCCIEIGVTDQNAYGYLCSPLLITNYSQFLFDLTSRTNDIIVLNYLTYYVRTDQKCLTNATNLYVRVPLSKAGPILRDSSRHFSVYFNLFRSE